MKQKRTSRTLKLVLLFIGILIVNSCEEDEIQDIKNPNSQHYHSHEPSIVTQKLSSSEFPHKQEIKSYLNQIIPNTRSQQIGVVSYNEGSGTDINPLSGLNIIQDQAEYTTYNSGHTYTFATYRDNSNNSGIIENIVLESDGNGEYKEYLFKYHLDETEYEELQNGLLSESDLINQTIIVKLDNGSANVLVSNSDWCYLPCVVIQGCIGCGGPGPCHDGSNTGDWGNCSELNKPTGPITYITYQWQPCGSIGGGSASPITNPPSGQPGVGDLPPAGGGGGVTPEPSDPNDGNPPDEQGYDPSNQEEPVDEIGGATKPVKDLGNSKTQNCSELENDSESATFKANMQILHNNIGGTNEKGFDIFALPNQSEPIFDGQIHLGNEQGIVYGPANTYKKGIAHNHLSNPAYKHAGTFTQNDLIGIYDLIYVAIETNDNPTLSKKDIVSYLVTPEGNYAIKLTDLYKIRDNFRKKYDNRGMTGGNNPDFDPRFRREIDRFYKRNKIKHGQPKDTQNLGMLNLIKTYDLGIELYEADDNFENWKKLEIDDNGTDIKRTPC